MLHPSSSFFCTIKIKVLPLQLVFGTPLIRSDARGRSIHKLELFKNYYLGGEPTAMFALPYFYRETTTLLLYQHPTRMITRTDTVIKLTKLRKQLLLYYIWYNLTIQFFIPTR